MKILYIIQRFHPAGGGAEESMKILAEYVLRDPNNEMTVWTSDALDIDAMWDVNKRRIPEKSEVYNRIKIRRFAVAPWILSNKWVNKLFRYTIRKIPIWPMRCLSESPTVFGMLWAALTEKNLDFDLIHATSAPYNGILYIALKLAKRLQKPLFISPKVHMGESESDPTYKVYFRKESVPFYEQADKLIVQTDSEREVIQKFCAKYGKIIPDEKFIKSEMGIYFEKMEGGDGERFRKQHGIKDDEKIVFYIGAKVEGKGVFNLVEAMKLYWEQNLVHGCNLKQTDNYEANQKVGQLSTQPVKLVLAGGFTREFEQFWDKQSEMVKQNTICLGFIDDSEKLDLLAAGDIFSMVSRSDSFGIVYLEAWYFGKPVLGCDNPMMREVIRDGVDGYLLAFSDVSGIAEKIKLLVNDEALAVKLGAAGHEKVMKKYHWDHQLEIIKKEYEKIINNVE